MARKEVFRLLNSSNINSVIGRFGHQRRGSLEFKLERERDIYIIEQWGLM